MLSGCLAGRLGVLGISVLFCTGCATPSRPGVYPVSAGRGYLTPEQIEQMPLLDRPDRPGHYIGNTIRQIDRWQTGQPD